jgi:hypothetical protein
MFADFRRLRRAPGTSRKLLQSRWIPSTCRGGFRSPTTLHAVSRVEGSKRQARRRALPLLRVASSRARARAECQSSLSGTGKDVQTPSKSALAIARERSLYPDPKGPGTLRVADWRSREMEPSSSVDRPRTALHAFPRRKTRFAAPEVPFIRGHPRRGGRRRANPPAFGAFASVPNTRLLTADDRVTAR